MPHALLERDITENEAATMKPRTSRPPSWLLILPLIFFAVHGTFSFQSLGHPVGGFAPAGGEVREHGFFGYVVIPAIAYSIVMLMIKSRLRSVLAFAKRFKMLTLLAILAVCSAAWSQEPSRSLLFGFLYLICTLFAYFLVVRFQPEELSSFIMRVGVVVSLLCVIMVIFFPQYGLIHDDVRVNGAWNGIFIDRTSAAKCLVFLLSPVLVFRSMQLRRRVLYALLLSLLIFQTRAVTADLMVSIYAVFATALLIRRKLGPRLLLVFSLVGVAAVVLIAIAGYSYLPSLLQAFGRDPTLSGRTEIWGALAGSISKRPLLGYGFYAFWLGMVGESGNVINATHWTFGYAHNGILEIAVQLGLIGVFVFLATLLRAMRDAWFCVRHDLSGRYDWCVAMIVLTVFYNFDEGTVVWPNELLSILYIVACCGLAQGAAQMRREMQDERRRRLEEAYN
jgi:O-antigen ligase